MIDTAMRTAIMEILADPSVRASITPALNPDLTDTVDTHTTQLQGLLADRSLGRVQNGPQWLSGVSVLDGTVTADKLVVNTLDAITVSTGSLNITGTVTASAAFPAVAARITIDSTNGIKGFNSAVTNTFKLGLDGSGFLGVGGNAITWNTAGVVVVPVAIISSLTIAAVGDGVLGGTYKTAATGQHINISTAGIVVYNATSEIAGNETFKLNATTGAVTATGSFTVKSAATGAHVTIDNAGGIAGYNATSEVTGNRTFLINAATGAGNLGLASTGITWDAAGAVSIPGSLLVGTVNASLITVGTLNASSITVANFAYSHITGGGAIGSSGTLGGNDLTVNSTGKLKFGTSSADYISNNIIHFDVTSAETAKIEMQSGSNTPKTSLNGLLSSTRAFGSLYASYNSGTSATYVSVNNQSTAAEVALAAVINASTDVATLTVGAGGGAPSIDAALNNNTVFSLVATNRAAKFYGYIYPGTGSATQTGNYIYHDGTNIKVSGNFATTGVIYPSNQTSRYMYDDGSNINVVTNTLTVSGSASFAGIRFNAIANGGSASNWGSGSPTGAAYFKININGTNYRVPFWADA